ncbi:hypothetical protein PUNSTDRAFT_115965 [Punctularia strigosozonata HHB-11173 SS5]|uniref:uncharacterized protein n=1 Tax=Punctularia strigosozonata (strain HHB-11173) TaxID=741275 RepID=UPI000441698B|nr:uncharacterized protein PUNSTDRAFT_115965 [Punctularia strigosozonata HHB-11173 SS5]EIN05568.1 hypothetical protein PUNSTDRAFT_115965 [Punctularia strigosozonata HHB-11173 SS5]
MLDTRLRKTDGAKTAAEMRYIEDTLASIRLRTRWRDPYEDWERDARKDALRTARKEQAQARLQRHHVHDQAAVEELERLANLHKKQVDEVAAQLALLERQRQQQEQRLQEQWRERDNQLWQRIENVIKFEEEKVKAKLEAERKAREEEERKRRLEVERRLAEERKKQEELEKRRQEEEMRKAEEAKAEEERKREQESALHRQQQQEAEAEERARLGITTPEEDWLRARKLLKSIKEGSMKTVKGNKELKALWSAGRRAINPKIGQITSDPEVINRVSQQIFQIIKPPNPHPHDVYMALLSALAKSILLQAETEVTAEKRAAGPLARVAVNLIPALDGFVDVFWAKMVQRTGGWPIPAIVPPTDVDGVPFTKETRRKALGYRNEETAPERWQRIQGSMRVYWEILKGTGDVQRPIDQRPRVWTYFTRVVENQRMLESAVAPMILHAAVEVLGQDAKRAYGADWVRLMTMVYEWVTRGMDPGGRPVGGDAPEGKAARVRLQIEIERMMNTP